MALLTILEYPDPRLRTIARPVERVDAALCRLLDEMFETMYEARGIGLAATQVNVHQRLLVADVSDGRDQPLALINPEITARAGATECEEGCLSVPGYYAKVPRAATIHVKALGRDGRAFELDADGLLAVCIQHEIDHLDGKLFVDYLSALKRQRLEKKWGRMQKTPLPTRRAVL